MIRLTGCLLVGLLALLPAGVPASVLMPHSATAQVLRASSGGALQGSAVNVKASAADVHVPDGAIGGSTSGMEGALRASARETEGLTTAPIMGEPGGTLGTERSMLQRSASAFAMAVFRALASQNSIALHPEMDEVLRPPDYGSDEPNLFNDAKRLYDAATSYRTERAVLSVDPLNLQWRLRVDLDRLLSGSSD